MMVIVIGMRLLYGYYVRQNMGRRNSSFQEPEVMYEALATWSYQDSQRSAARFRSDQCYRYRAGGERTATRIGWRATWLMSMWNTRGRLRRRLRRRTGALPGSKEWVGAVVTGEYSQTGTKDGKRHDGERYLRGHVAEAQWPLAGDRQRISLSDP